MTKHPLRQKFIEFLISRNCLMQYAKNKQKSILHIEPELWIEKAFKWHRTSEGATFWDDLDFEWQKICNQNK